MDRGACLEDCSPWGHKELDVTERLTRAEWGRACSLGRTRQGSPTCVSSRPNHAGQAWTTSQSQGSERGPWTGLDPAGQAPWGWCLVRAGLCPWPSNLLERWAFHVLHCHLKHASSLQTDRWELIGKAVSWLGNPTPSLKGVSGEIRITKNLPQLFFNQIYLKKRRHCKFPHNT